MSFTVTAEWVHEHATKTMGWNAKQLAVLGVEWPPRRGWIRRCCGVEITDQQKAEFERLARVTART